MLDFDDDNADEEPTEVSDVQVPGIRESILDDLDRLFPERCADLSWTDRQVWFHAGERNVVRFLRDQFNRERSLSRK